MNAERKREVAPWIAREATRADIPKILDLHERAFEKKISKAQYEWQFFDNPFLGPLVWIAEAPSGEIIGHYSLVPVPFLNQGKESTILFSILSMVDPRAQRSGILKKLEQTSQEKLKRLGLHQRVSFLNDNSLPVYTKNFGWKEVGDNAPIHYIILNTRPLLKQKFGKTASLLSGAGNLFCQAYFRQSTPSLPSHEIVTLSSLDESYDLIWKSFSKNFSHTVNRNQKYMTWRFLENPKSYQLTGVYRQGELIALAVYRCEEKYGVLMTYLADLLWQPGESGAALSLMQTLSDELRREGIAMMTSLVTDQEEVQKVFRQAGFRKMPKPLMPHGIHFTVKGENLSASYRDWYLSWSDHDIV